MEKKKEPGTHCLHMLRISEKIRNFGEICVTANFPMWKMHGFEYMVFDHTQCSQWNTAEYFCSNPQFIAMCVFD